MKQLTRRWERTMACGLQISCAMGTMPSVGGCQAVRWGLLSDLTIQELPPRLVVLAATKDSTHGTCMLDLMAQVVCLLL